MIAMKLPIPVLMYHSLDPNRIPGKLSVSLEVFKKHLNFLKKMNFQILSIQQYLDRNMQASFFEKVAVLTFDDGYLDNYTHAYPLLEKMGFPCTFFVNPQSIGTKGFMTWDMLQKMSRTPGIEVQSHGISHDPLKDLDEMRAKISICESKKILEHMLGKGVTGFSYPSGSFNDSIMKWVKESGYQWACAASRVHEKRFLSSPYAIKRIKISCSSTRVPAFAFRVFKFYALFGKI